MDRNLRASRFLCARKDRTVIAPRLRRCLVVALAVALAGVIGLPLVLSAAGRTPMEVIRSGSERGLDIIKGALSGGGPSLKERRAEILCIVDEYFNFEEMARRSLGRPWKDQSPDNQREFVQLFKQLLFNVYVSRVEAAATSDTRIAYDQEKIEGDYANIGTRVTSRNQPDVLIEYRLRRIENGEWKTYDVVIEGISLVNNYRQQFGSILNNESFKELLNRLRAKVAEQ